MFLIRFIFYFTLSFLILCIPIGNNLHLFDKLYSVVTPYIHKALVTTKHKVSATKRYSVKLYSNSEPGLNDEIKVKLAGLKKMSHETTKENPEDMYTAEEKERLKKVLSHD